MADSRCGLRCTGCGYKQAHHCGGCIETQGRPFHGACPVAQCCQNRGFSHCGQCPELPCALLWNYSCDPVHGDDPAGSRIVQCRSWRRMEIRNFSDFCALLLECGFSLGGGNPKGVFSLLAPGCLEQQEDSPIRSHTGDPDTDPWEWRMRVLEERQEKGVEVVIAAAHMHPGGPPADGAPVHRNLPAGYYFGICAEYTYKEHQTASHKTAWGPPVFKCIQNVEKVNR